MPTTPPARAPLRVLDLIAGIVIAVIGGLIGLIMLSYMVQLGGLATACEGIAPDGMRCDPGYLSAILILGNGLVVFAWFITAGFFVVRVLRRQLAFFLPIIGIVAMLASFYLVAFLLQAYAAN